MDLESTCGHRYHVSGAETANLNRRSIKWELVFNYYKGSIWMFKSESLPLQEAFKCFNQCHCTHLLVLCGDEKTWPDRQTQPFIVKGWSIFNYHIIIFSWFHDFMIQSIYCILEKFGKWPGQEWRAEISSCQQIKSISPGDHECGANSDCKILAEADASR